MMPDQNQPMMPGMPPQGGQPGQGNPMGEQMQRIIMQLTRAIQMFQQAAQMQGIPPDQAAQLLMQIIQGGGQQEQQPPAPLGQQPMPQGGAGGLPPQVPPMP